MFEQHTHVGEAATEDVVRVESGLLAGTVGADPNVRVFKGIPFAAPPVGERRWRPPERPIAWSGVRPGDTFGPTCPQFPRTKGSFYQLEFYTQEEPQNEDCLFLNIWTAAHAADAKRPVMVWFHGGGMVEGSGSLPSFHGEALARKGVVLVTANYRLGLLGYLAHPELTAESAQHASGNYGLLDQIEALRWVQRNIAAFGGDAGNVTIFGQSGGAMSVFALLASPLAKGLFQRAIGQSGSGFLALGPRATFAEAEERGVRFAAMRNARSIRELRALPAETLLGIDRSILSFHPGPVVDGWVLPAPASQLLAEGKCHDVSLMLGGTADEATTLIEDFGAVSAADFRSSAAQRYGARADEFRALYPADTEEEARQAQIFSLNDHFAAGMRVWANVHNAHSAHKAYMYHFDRRSPGRNSAYYGAFHSSELVYVFGTLDSVERPWEAVDRHLADVMTSCWANFAARGDPNFPGLPTWPTYDSERDVVMELGDRIGPISAPRKVQLAFHQREIERSLNR